MDALSNENRRMRLAHERAYQQELRAWARGHDWVPAESRSSLLACVVSVAPSNLHIPQNDERVCGWYAGAARSVRG